MLFLLLAAPFAFDMKEIDTNWGVGSAVLLVDVDGDGKPDIVAVGRATNNVRIYTSKK